MRKRCASFTGTKFGGGGKKLESESEGGKKGGGWGERNFGPPELKSFSKFSVRIFPEIGSDFVQGAEPIRKSPRDLRLARKRAHRVLWKNCQRTGKISVRTTFCKRKFLNLLLWQKLKF